MSWQVVVLSLGILWGIVAVLGMGTWYAGQVIANGKAPSGPVD